MNEPQLSAEMKYVHIDWKDMYKDELAQELADERKKVLSEVLEMVKHQRLSPKDGYFTDERKRHQNSLRAELRTKLNQLKGGE